MVKFGIISKNIVLSEYLNKQPRHAQSGIILIEDELIYDIILIEIGDNIEFIRAQYKDWNLKDYSNLFISPGIIDINTRIEYDSYENLTQESVKGGVTLLASEPGYYHEAPPFTNLYCDIAKISVIDDVSMQFAISTDTIALKAYLFPPGPNTKSIANIHHILSRAESAGLPLIIDPTMPDARMLYMASPLRMETTEARSNSEAQNSNNSLFAAAFPESMEKSSESSSPSSGSSSSDKLPAPLKSTSLQTDEFKQIFTHHRSISDEKKLGLIKVNPEIVIKEEEEGITTPDISSALKVRKWSHDIYHDLDLRIRASQQSIEDLCRAESSTYGFSGSTNFLSIDAPKKSSSLTPTKLEPIDSPEPSKSAQSENPPLKGRRSIRPVPIQVKSPVQLDLSMNYSYCLANYPEHWEISGIERVLECMKPDIKVHFANVSSAGAINKVRQSKSRFRGVTCEIAASHLCFTSMSVAPGDTRFKNSPPIRNQGNCNLLWDLLKMKGIDCISSQHASINPENKLSGSFQQTLNGISSAGLALQSIWNVLNIPISSQEQLEHYIIRLSKWFSLIPSKILGVDAQRGKIDKGYYADLIVWNPYIKYNLDSSYKYSQTSPFMSSQMMGRIEEVYVRGNLAYNGIDMLPVGKLISR